ncbi:MAG: hypothetical protein CMI54_06960 [Parcubacteria group bacterium]|nr:hypothetical protein [Parcubacteria group bacterium]|tara:strand:- start:2772 stop:3989 length:1218 start_codon:yes stop_codon:yes gene_type:complete
MYKKSFLIIFFAAFFIFPVTGVIAGVDDNVSGYAWSENIGWISFNNTSGGGIIDYGVNIGSQGKFSGYAWSENIGWISFNNSDVNGCPTSPCQVKVDFDTGLLSGWAKALGFGDGWIHLNGTNYGTSINQLTGEFSGWAWGDTVIGWISFNDSNQGVFGASDYKVTVDSSIFSQPPRAFISCDPSDCNSSDCIAYTGCPFHLINQSTDPDGQSDIVKSEWDILNWGANPDLSCTTPNALCDITPQTQIMGSGNFTAELYIEDQIGQSDTIIQPFQIKQEALADFKCSLDNQNWQDCETLELSVKEVVYFLDQSTPSEGAFAIIERIWTFQNGDPSQDLSNNLNPSTKFQSGGAKDVTLTITDDQSRTDSKIYTINSQLPFPEYKEIPPILWLRNFLAIISGLFAF